MSKNLCCIFFLLLPFCSLAQNFEQKRDKIFQKMATSKSDTAQINAALDAAFLYMSKNMDSALFWAQHAEVFSKKIRYNNGAAWAFNRIGRILLRQGKLEQSELYFLKALAYFEQEKDDKGLSTIYFAFASLENRRGNFEKELFYCEKAAFCAEKLNNPLSRAVTFINLGIAYQNLSRYPKSMENYFKALENYTSVENNAGIAISYVNLGNLYNITGNDAMALVYYDSAFHIREKEGNFSEMSKIYNNIGTVYNDEKNFDAAHRFLHKALFFSEKVGDKVLMQEQSSNLTEHFILRERYDSAEFYNHKLLLLARETGSDLAKSYHFYHSATIAVRRNENKLATGFFEHSLDLRLKMGNQKLCCETMIELGKLQLRMSNLEIAEKAAKAAFDSTAKYFLLDLNKDAALLLTEIYEKNENWKKCAFFAKIARNLNDSIKNIERAKVIFATEAKFKLREKQQEIELLEKEKIIKNDEIFVLRIYILLAFCFLMFFVAVLFYFRKKNQFNRLRLEKEKAKLELDKLKAERERERAESEKKQAELEKLKAIEEKNLAIVEKDEVKQNLDDAVELVQSKTKVLSSLKDIIEESSGIRKNNLRDDVLKLIQEIEQEITKTNDLKEFNILGADFIGIISQKYPELSLHEVRICTYIRLGYSSKQIASFLNIETESVSKARNRLRKKLGIDAKCDIADFLKELTN